MADDRHPGTRRPAPSGAGRARSERPLTTPHPAGDRPTGPNPEGTAEPMRPLGTRPAPAGPVAAAPAPASERPASSGTGHRVGPPSGPPPISPVSIPRISQEAAAGPAPSFPAPIFPPSSSFPASSSFATSHRPEQQGADTGPMPTPAGRAATQPPTGPVSTGPVPTSPVPTGPVPTSPVPTGPVPDAPSGAGGAAPHVAAPARQQQQQARPTGPGEPGRGPNTQPTQLFRAIDPGAQPPAWRPPETVREARMDREPDRPDRSAGASLVRPYARTGGRTKPGRHLDLEALVRTTDSGRDAWQSPLLTPEHTSVIELCSGTVSVAEIAARLAVPLGVARVIIADMVDLGLVEVMKTSASTGDERDPAFLRRVLSGLQRL